MVGKVPAEASIPENSIINHTFPPFWNMSNNNPAFSRKRCCHGVCTHSIQETQQPSRRVDAGLPTTMPHHHRAGSGTSQGPHQWLGSVFSIFERKSRRPRCKPAAVVRSRWENCKPSLSFKACVSLWFIAQWVRQTRLREITGFSRLRQIH